MRRAVEINLDKTRHLRFDMMAKANIQSALGKPMHKVFEDIANIGEYELLNILLYGLYGEDKTLTLEKVSNILFECDLLDDEINDKLFEAFAESNGKGDAYRALKAGIQPIENEKNQ